MGSRGARGATAGGGTAYLAAGELRDKILRIAAGMLGLNAPDELRLRLGKVERRLGGQWDDTGIALVDVARRAYLDPLNLPAGMAPGLDCHKTYDPPPLTFSNATHVCEVELDVATGALKILRYVIAEDCGTVLNQMLVEGQQHGATAMGLGGALYEQALYDADGQNLSASFVDYLLPTAAELPGFEIISMHTPNRRTPAGLKGMAEGGVMGAIGAITSAVNDALAPFGVVADRQPLTPMYLRSLLRGRT
ncbi:MAG: molybdopterin-dependent oxidoreductase, partial [Proteobacteria bacterium]|nr:molybdopterin-dependent oxidoreductase [Pseudomonadota bacterium]